MSDICALENGQCLINKDVLDLKGNIGFFASFLRVFCSQLATFAPIFLGDGGGCFTVVERVKKKACKQGHLSPLHYLFCFGLKLDANLGNCMLLKKSSAVQLLDK